MLEKSRNVVFFQWCVCRVTWKVGLLKRRVRSHVVRDQKLHAVVAKSAFSSENVTKRAGFGALLGVLMSKNCTPLWRTTHVEVNMYKTGQVPSTFLKFWCRKNCTRLVARSTIWSENAQNRSGSEHFFEGSISKIARRCGEKRISKSKWKKKLTLSEHFLKFRCRKIARRCGEKHVCEWKCTKHARSGQFFEVRMSKNCMNLWREAPLSVKMYKYLCFGALFQVQMSNN